MAQARRSYVSSEDWQHLVDTFRNHYIEYDFTLQLIQTVFKSVNNPFTNRFNL